jgi:thioredoxin:protein disulfide reductase
VPRVVSLIVALTLASGSPCLAAKTVFSASAAWRGAAPRPGGQAVLAVTVKVDEGWHVNSNAPLEDYLIPTSLRLDLPKGWAAAPPAFPPHQLVSLAFSDKPVAVFEGIFTITTHISVAPGAAVEEPLRGAVEAQACNNSQCLPPTQVDFEVGPPAEAAASPAAATGAGTGAGGAPPPMSASAGLSQRFLRGSLFLQLLIVFVAGLALNLTPCVYPLIPITVGFFIAQEETSGRRTLGLAVVYVLGMSVTYSALGVAAALTGRLFGSALQSPWVVGVVVALLLALATSMFGLWELRVPAWATRASGGRTGAGGALLMGLVVGLVAAPCIGPFVLGLLTYVGKRQDVVLGFALFFTLSLGLGLPYLLLAVSSRALEKLPNSGTWMVGVRQLFGVLLVALAGYFVQPFLPPPWSDDLLGGLLALGGLYLLVVARPGHQQPWIDRAMRLVSSAMLIAGLLLLPLRGGRQPSGLTWAPYDEAVATQAIAAGGPVVVDFYADWCVPCKELDAKTFSDPAVRRELQRFSRFKVNLTRDDETTEALRNRYGVLGVPTIAFFDGGKEVVAARLTGFEPAAQFLRRLRLAAPE